MNEVKGNYTTQRDGGIAYTYEATWAQTEQGAMWNSKVRRDGQLAGTPNGQIVSTHNVPLEELVKRLVETSIEIRAGVD